MKKQDELRGQIATMKIAASALIDSGKLAEAKEEMAKMKSIQEQITLLDQLDNDFAAQASAAEGTGVTAAAASGKSAGNDAVKAFATAPKPWIKATDYLTEVRERLQHVVIENLDFERLLKVYDRPDALFYLDPPYHGTEKYYSAQFSQADHERLKGTLESVKGKWLLSYNDDDYIRELYKGYHIEQIGRRNQLSAKDKGEEYRELIIRNY